MEMTDNTPFFIIGAGRSGTTLLRLILAGHSRIHIPPETWFIEDLVRELPLASPLSPEQVARAVVIMTTHYRWPDLEIAAVDLRAWAEALESPQLVDIINLVYRRQLEIHGKLRCGDKTPPYFRILPQLSIMYNEAKFIHLIRDGRDVAISNIDVGWYRYYDRRQFPWTIAMQRRREYLRSPLAAKILEVRYEDLVVAPELTIGRICEFLGEKFEPGMLNWQSRVNLVPERERSIHASLPRPLSREVVGIWQQKLSRWECFAVEACLHTDLCQLGYRLRFSGAPWRPLLAVAGWLLFMAAPLLKRGVPYLQRRNYLREAIYI
jgi:hypothetical protein